MNNLRRDHVCMAIDWPAGPIHRYMDMYVGINPDVTQTTKGLESLRPRLPPVQELLRSPTQRVNSWVDTRGKANWQSSVISFRRISDTFLKENHVYSFLIQE